MPFRINGIGTGYMGRSNVQARPGYCESCRSQYMMESYETGLWFTVLFIPVIPLGRHQILDYCPACTQHRSIPLKEWEAIKEESVQQGVDNLSVNTSDPDAAMELHATYESTMQMEQADQLANVMKSSFANNVDVLIYLAAWYDHVQRDQESDACFQKALQLEPDNPNALRGVGIGCLQQGRLDEAEQHLLKMAPPSENYAPDMFIALAEGFQGQSRHDKALELFDMVVAHSPELQKERSFRKMMRKSQKKMGR